MNKKEPNRPGESTLAWVLRRLGANRDLEEGIPAGTPLPLPLRVGELAEDINKAAAALRAGQVPPAVALGAAAASLKPPFDDTKTYFHQGDPVRKVGGDYSFDGTVLTPITKLSGVVRYAVEDDRGVVHIFSARQLEKRL